MDEKLTLRRPDFKWFAELLSRREDDDA